MEEALLELAAGELAGELAGEETAEETATELAEGVREMEAETTGRLVGVPTMVLVGVTTWELGRWEWWPPQGLAWARLRRPPAAKTKGIATTMVAIEMNVVE